MRVAKAGRKSKILTLFTEKVFNSQTLPWFLALSIVGILFVFVRMKGIEQDYKFNELNQKIQMVRLDNKELKANKAKELSVKKLQESAKKYHLVYPSENKVIVIP